MCAFVVGIALVKTSPQWTNNFWDTRKFDSCTRSTTQTQRKPTDSYLNANGSLCQTQQVWAKGKTKQRQSDILRSCKSWKDASAESKKEKTWGVAAVRVKRSERTKRAHAAQRKLTAILRRAGSEVSFTSGFQQVLTGSREKALLKQQGSSLSSSLKTAGKNK